MNAWELERVAGGEVLLIERVHHDELYLFLNTRVTARVAGEGALREWRRARRGYEVSHMWSELGLTLLFSTAPMPEPDADYRVVAERELPPCAALYRWHETIEAHAPFPKVVDARALPEGYDAAALVALASRCGFVADGKVRIGELRRSFADHPRGSLLVYTHLAAECPFAVIDVPAL